MKTIGFCKWKPNGHGYTTSCGHEQAKYLKRVFCPYCEGYILLPPKRKGKAYIEGEYK